MSWKQSPLWYTDCRSNISKTHGHQRYLLRLVSTLSCPVVVQSHRFNQKKNMCGKHPPQIHISCLQFAPPSPPRSPPPPTAPQSIPLVVKVAGVRGGLEDSSAWRYNPPRSTQHPLEPPNRKPKQVEKKKGSKLQSLYLWHLGVSKK